MKISRIDTVRLAEFPNLLWVEIRTDDGVQGLGETFFDASVVDAYIHDVAAPRLIGADPFAIGAVVASLSGYLGRRGSGAEMRGRSAIDLALWDLYARAIGQPLWQALGGRVRESIRTYNTCAGPTYVRTAKGQQSANWGLSGAPGRYDDLQAFLTRADELAADLLESGITGMKIWPFDLAAEASGGLYISGHDLKRALEPFARIRKAVGDAMDIMVEFHSLWNLTSAIRIAEALAPFATFWHEDPIRMDSLRSLRRYAERSKAPVCASETLSSIAAFRDLLETEAVGVVMLDVAWCGGLSEARKIAAMAEAWHLPVAPHDCTGPVVLAASTHLCLHLPNALVQETVRAFLNGWYSQLVTALPMVQNGFITAPEGAGLGLTLAPDLGRHFTLSRRSTTAS
ncbi:MAG: mandelate racemase/muconate lactonizing enzyme family protein [Acetobacteraceae bacterium]